MEVRILSIIVIKSISETVVPGAFELALVTRALGPGHTFVHEALGASDVMEVIEACGRVEY